LDVVTRFATNNVYTVVIFIDKSRFVNNNRMTKSDVSEVEQVLPSGYVDMCNIINGFQ